jgi:hypothetical protein
LCWGSDQAAGPKRLREEESGNLLWASQGEALTAVQITDNMYGMKTTMEQTKLTVRVSRDLLENLKRYARQNDTTITGLIEAYLRRIPVKGTLDEAPIVQRLSGSMSTEVSVQDYRAHLEEKYGQKTQSSD